MVAIKQQHREKLVLPNGCNSLLLHSCCAPCSVEVLEALRFSDIVPTVLFYNPNIHPQDEYNMRRDENIRQCLDYDFPFIDAEVDLKRWYAKTNGMENEPERGIRCTSCFDMRFEFTARYASQHQFDTICSTLGLSRWKNFEQINNCGERAAASYPPMQYWTHNWRKKGGSERMVSISKEKNYYQQEYCGCVYSLRDKNLVRNNKKLAPIKRGVKFYTHTNGKSNQK